MVLAKRFTEKEKHCTHDVILHSKLSYRLQLTFICLIKQQQPNKQTYKEIVT